MSCKDREGGALASGALDSLCLQPGKTEAPILVPTLTVGSGKTLPCLGLSFLL